MLARSMPSKVCDPQPLGGMRGVAGLDVEDSGGSDLGGAGGPNTEGSGGLDIEGDSNGVDRLYVAFELSSGVSSGVRR